MRAGVWLAISLFLLISVLAQAKEPGMPEPVRKAMDHAYPGWRAPIVSKYLSELLASGDGSALFIHGDWDGDGLRDYAVQFVDPGAPKEWRQRVIAAMHRGKGFEIVPLDSFPQDSVWYLETERRGTEVADLSSDPDGGKSFHLAHDAIFISYEEKGGGTCYWTGKSFRCISSSD